MHIIIFQISVCDRRLLAIKVTDTMSRVPRSLQDFGHWKGISYAVPHKPTLCAYYLAGAELRNWLLFFSIPILKGILPANFLNHLAMLVTGVYICSSQSIDHRDFVLAQQLLLQFCKDFSMLYGKDIFSFCCVYPDTLYRYKSLINECTYDAAST